MRLVCTVVVFNYVLHQATWFGQLHIFHCLYCLKFALVQGVNLTWGRAQFYRHPLLLSLIWHRLQLPALFSASCAVFELWHCLMFHLSYVSSFHYSVSSLVSWTVLRAGLIMMLLSPFSCRRALKDWKGVKFLQGEPCWFVPVILWSYE